MIHFISFRPKVKRTSTFSSLVSISISHVHHLNHLCSSFEYIFSYDTGQWLFIFQNASTISNGHFEWNDFTYEWTCKLHYHCDSDYQFNVLQFVMLGLGFGLLWFEIYKCIYESSSFCMLIIFVHKNIKFIKSLS